MKKILLTIIIISNFYVFANENNRKYDIYDKTDLAKEIIYLTHNSDLSNKDSLNRLMKYVNNNSEEKQSLINNLTLYKTDNKEEKLKINIIINAIQNNVITLKNNNIPKNGSWSGQSGNSLFLITGHTKEYNKNEIFEKAPNGIPFELGYPNFSEFRIGNLIPLENPTGSLQHDLSNIYDKLLTNSISFNNVVFTSKEEIEEYLFFNNAKFHYALKENGIELIPNQVYSVIDYEIPHLSKNK